MSSAAGIVSVVASLLGAPLLAAGVVYEGGEGPGKDKHIVLVSGDEEYRSEEGLPQLAAAASAGQLSRMRAFVLPPRGPAG